MSLSEINNGIAHRRNRSTRPRDAFDSGQTLHLLDSRQSDDAM